MRWLSRYLWEAGIAIAGMLLLLVLMVCVPVPTVGAYEVTPGLTTLVTVQETPTVDATVTALNKEKLAQEVQQLKNQNEPDPFGWLRTNASILFSTLVVVSGGLFGLWRWRVDRRDARDRESKDRREVQDKELADRKAERERRDEEQKRWLKDQEAEREKRAEERFQAVVEGLGSTNLATQVGAAIMLRTFLRPGYEQFYSQVFDLAVVYLRLRNVVPDTAEPLDPLCQTLIPVFTESFPLARDYLKQSPQFLDATYIRLDTALMKEADLQHIWMPEAYLRDANIRGINLHKAELRDTDFFDTSLHWANLSEANLFEASFRKARLYMANFRRADLTWANFAEADLTEADFTQAYLNGANFRGAKVTPEQLGKAKSLDGIIMPDGSMPYGRYSEPDWTPEWYSNLQP
jgi:pentapeptide repeat protein